MTEYYLLNIDHMKYAEAWDLMRGLAAMRAETGTNVLILVEHEPVFTLGRRTPAADILASEEILAREGINLYRIERGGLATYHGPGQLVVYPVFRLRSIGLGVADLVHELEEVIIRAAGDFDVRASRQEGHPGVWAGHEKIASVGLAVRRGVTFHGIALNYNPNFQHFNMINPCGLSGGCITSLAKLSGRDVDPGKLRESVAGHFSEVLGQTAVPWTVDQAREAVRAYEESRAEAGVA